MEPYRQTLRKVDEGNQVIVVASNYTWHLLDTWKNKPQGQVWRVNEPGGKVGFFKFAFKEQWYDAGPIVGNEWIAATLAKRTGFETAELDVVSIPYGNTLLSGIVSIQKDISPIVSWRTLDKSVTERPYEFLNDADNLFGVIAFDTWITNLDRGSGKNILFYRPKGQQRFQFYLIDHGYALYGCERKWALHSPLDAYWHQIWDFYHIPKGWQAFATKRVLKQATEAIHSLDEHVIRHIVDDVPDSLYTKAMQKDTIAMLLYRQKHLTHMLNEWLHYRGVKECLI